MNDFELWSVILMVLGIIVTLLIALIRETKKVIASPEKVAITFFNPLLTGPTVYR